LRDFRPDPSPPGLDALSREAAARFGDTAAFAFPTPDGRLQSLSFAEVDALTDRLAMRFMRVLGVAPGTVVAIRLPNCLHHPLAVLAA
jgi:long-chain acyl-CoA synthetase